MTKAQKTGQAEAIAALRKMLRRGATVRTIVTHVARSGMSRSISCYVARKGEIERLDWYVARALNMRLDGKNGGVKIGGCGMDMGFQIVYLLGRKLWPSGVRKSHGTRNGKPDTEGGYALKQRWM